MFTTPNMSLTAWDLETDPYDHTDLFNNWVAVDQHDHSPGRGAPLTPASIPVLDQTNLGPCSVNSTQICDNAVISSKIASNAVREVHITAGAVTNSKIGSSAVDSPQLKDGSVTEPKLATSAVSTAKLADGAVSNLKVGNNAVSEHKLANQAVTTPKLANQSVTNGKVADAAIDTPQLKAEAVTQNKIAANAVGVREHDVVPMVYVSINRRHSIDSGDFHEVAWDEQRYDTDNMWDNDNRDKVRIRTAGVYLIEGGVMWEDGGNQSGGRRAKIRRNDNPITGSGPLATMSESGSGAPYRVREPMVAVINCFEGDTIDLIVEQTSGADQDILPDGLNTHLTATWIAPGPNS